MCVCGGVCCAAAGFLVHTPLLDVTRLSSSVTHNGLKVANLSKGSSSDPTSLECFLFLYFYAVTGSQNILIIHERAAGSFRSPFPLQFCLYEGLKFLFLLTPPGSRDDRHRAHSRRVVGKTGHHGHVNHPPAQHPHPRPPPTNVN